MDVRVISKRLSIVFSIFVLGFIVFACYPKTKLDLYGAYTTNYEFAKEELILSKDGTFTQKVMLKANSKVNTAEGKWSYDPDDGYVTFYENFMVVLDGFRKFRQNYTEPEPGLVSKPATNYFGRIRIGSDEGIVYKKVK